MFKEQYWMFFGLFSRVGAIVLEAVDVEVGNFSKATIEWNDIDPPKS